MKINLRIPESYETSGNYVAFDYEKWDTLCKLGTGRLGHYTTQGTRNLYVSPRINKSGEYYFVISGTGYCSSKYGGYNWGDSSWVISQDEALSLLGEHNPKCIEKYFSERLECV